jgi:hypothetical protein
VLRFRKGERLKPSVGRRLCNDAVSAVEVI